MDNEAMRSLDELYNALCVFTPKKYLTRSAMMSKYTTLRLGGPADLLCEAISVSQLSAALMASNRLGVKTALIGNGSNLLVLDGGIRGLVIHIGEQFSEISEPVPLPDGRFAITAQAGASLQKLCSRAADCALSGLEFASGIPGTVGGATFMNAGAYGGEMKDVVSTVTACGAKGQTLAFTSEEMAFGYRVSRFAHADEIAAITSVTVTLKLGDQETIRATMREFAARRREKQPISVPSCGSTFKRPEGQFAGTLIDQCGLKGCRVGGASVSALHAGFLVNDMEGSAADYLALIALVQKTVYAKTGVMLTPEVRIIGEEAELARL